MKGIKRDTNKRVRQKLCEKMEWSEEKNSIHITTEETTLTLFICETVILNIAANYAKS